MSIKSDNWICRMAEQHKMIEPFESGPPGALFWRAACDFLWYVQLRL